MTTNNQQLTNNKLKALIFDVDGTLANTEKDGHRVGFNQAFKDKGLDWHWSPELYGELLSVAGGKERIKYYIDRYNPQLPQVADLTVFIQELHQLKNKYYQDLLKKGAIPLRPGVKRLILEAKENNIRLAIATTTTLHNAIALLDRTLDPSWFEIIAAGDIVPNKKPAPDIYFYTLEKLNLAPENCVVIEDTEHGLSAATAAGIKTIVTVNNYTEQQDFSKAAIVVSHLGESDNQHQVIKGNSSKGYIDLDTIQLLI